MKKISRARFLKILLAGTALAPGFAVLGADFGQLRGDRVGWARLKTTSPQWRRHAGADPILTRFFRDETTLNIDLVWYAADVERMDELGRYPLLFSQNVGMVADQLGRENVAEYIRRGGFLLVDACHDFHVTPDFDEFLSQHFAFYSEVLPESRIVSLPPTHDVYHCFFDFPDGKPPHTFMNNVYDPRKARHGLYGVMIGSRMAGLIGVCGWQCGWDKVTEHASLATPTDLEVACLRIVVNIYIYAMTQGA